ncbi:noggin-like [Heterodontus francisci]|uniref:noggin-like n=1 Tax=Heterodontus francisci TaxID=7792 RepID=UPI00355C4516
MDVSRYLLFLYLAVWGGVSGQHYLHLRPSPSDQLPLLELLELPDPQLDPKQSDLDEATLRLKLASDFDPNFMSLRWPEDSGAAGPLPGLESRGSGGMPGQSGRMELGSRHGMNKKSRRRLQQWLWERTYCPVTYTWRDLGSRFWPRFIKDGSCYRGRSCSVPQGMTCKKAKSISKTVLRWYCPRGDRHRHRSCNWIPVQFSIISACTCSC